MKSFGSLLLMFGLGSIILNFMNYEFRLLMWVDNWGPTVGWAIRIAMIVVGGLLWVVGNKQEKAAAATG